MSLAAIAAGRSLARAYLALADPQDSTVAHHRDRRTNAFAAALLAIWHDYHRGTITRSQAEQRISALVHATAVAVLAAYARQYAVSIADLRRGQGALRFGQALAAAGIAGNSSLWLWTPGTEPPSDALAKLRADQAAGPIWGLHFAIEGQALSVGAGNLDVQGTWRSQGDDRVCPGCEALDGQTFSYADIPTTPGAGDTECGGACRCLIEWNAG